MEGQIATMAVAWSTRSPTYAPLQTSSASIASASTEGRAGDRMHSRARRSYPIVSYARSAMSVSRRSARLGLEQDAWLAGMDPENVKEFGWALAGEDVLTRELQALQQQFEERARVDPSTVLQDLDMSESDRAELARPEIAQIIRESTFEWAVNGVGGWVDDDLAVLQPWGFDLADISVPVLVRYGMTDVFVPPAHGEWLAANVPGCIVKINATAGHLGANQEQEIAENARWLSTGIAPDGSRTHAPAAD